MATINSWNSNNPGVPININTTGTQNTLIGTSGNSGTISIGNTSSGAVTIDCGTAGITVGTTANAHTSTFGSTNSTSATTIQSGSGALSITSTNGALTINSGTGALGISTDASATTVSFATGAAVKTVTLGSTNSTSSTAIKSGTGNVAINSGLTIDSTGRNNNTVQPAFLAYLSATVTNVTGDGTFYTVLWNSEVFDQNSNFDTGTGIFTAPITGKYQLQIGIWLQDLTTAHTDGIFGIVTSNRNYLSMTGNFGAIKAVSNQWAFTMSAFADMDAGDTSTTTVQVSNGTKVVDILSGLANDPRSWFMGNLVC